MESLCSSPFVSVNRAVQKNTSTEVSVTIRQKEPVASVNAARKIYRADNPEEAAGFQTLVLKKESSMYEVRATRSSVKNVVQSLRDFQDTFPDVVADDTLSMASAYMTSPVMTSAPVVYGLAQNREDGCCTFDVTVTVTLQDPYLCHVTIARHVS